MNANTLTDDLTNLLESETSVLSPEDAPALAASLAANLPPEYAAAPALLAALEAMAHDPEEDGYQGCEDRPCACRRCALARSAIAAATGGAS